MTYIRSINVIMNTLIARTVYVYILSSVTFLSLYNYAWPRAYPGGGVAQFVRIYLAANQPAGENAGEGGGGGKH